MNETTFSEMQAYTVIDITKKGGGDENITITTYLPSHLHNSNTTRKGRNTKRFFTQTIPQQLRIIARANYAMR
jgi:hypothetical protein